MIICRLSTRRQQSAEWWECRSRSLKFHLERGILTMSIPSMIAYVVCFKKKTPHIFNIDLLVLYV